MQKLSLHLPRKKLREMLTHKEDFVLKTDQTDTKQALRFFSFMCIAQEMAGVHATKLKFGYEELMAHNEVWVLSRAHIRFINPPKWRDKITIETWHKGKTGLFWNRDFALYGPTGSTDVVATTAWVIMNTITRRIDRHTPFDQKEEVVSNSLQRDAIETPCDKIAIPQGKLEEVREKKVLYSDIDMNGHANNAKYIEWIIDSLPIEFISQKEITDLKINYISEAQLGETLKISSGKYDDNRIYIEGARENGIVFQSEITYK